MDQHPLSRYRNSAGMTQKELAAELKLAQSSVARFENGTLVPSRKTLKKIATVFDKDLGEVTAEHAEWEKQFIQHAWRVKL